MHAFIIVADPESYDFPEVLTDGAAVESTPTVVMVMTRPDIEGDVVVKVVEEEPGQPGTCVHDAELVLSGSVIVVGDIASAQEHLVGLSEGGSRRLRILVDEPGYASRVIVQVGPRPRR